MAELKMTPGPWYRAGRFGQEIRRNYVNDPTAPGELISKINNALEKAGVTGA